MAEADGQLPERGTCAGCGCDDATFLCGRCKRAFFCSKTCLRSGWQSHKAECLKSCEEESATVASSSSSSLPTQPPKAQAADLPAPASEGDPPYLLRGKGKLGPLVPRGGYRIALVSTLRDVEDQFMLWLEWFRIVGFAHLFLYFDDPARDEASIAEARGTYSSDFVSFAMHTPELKAEWSELRSWPKFKAFTDDRMCRQLLNIAHALRRANRARPRSNPEAVDWVMHLDHDELFLPPADGLQAHFSALEAGSCRLCLYQNYEAVPEDHTLTPFLDVSLFKVPSGRIPKTPLGAAGMNFWVQRTQAGNYFLYYDNGKSAVRIRQKSGEDIAPTSVHLLFPPDDLEELMTSKRGWTNFPDHELPEMNLTWLSSRHDEVVAGAKVLHYPATHFDRLFRKYDHLKDFPAVRFGGDLVVPPSFHLEARDEYVKYMDEGSEVQLAKLKGLLEKAAFLKSADEVQSQMETGSVVVIDSVRESLRLGTWVAPRPLRDTVADQLQRRPTIEGMARIQKLKRRDAEVLFADTGGLLKSLDSGLDSIAQRLETAGWAACVLGAHETLIARALTEAKGLEARMAAGTTVAQNEVIDQSLPGAKRGDRILFLQEQGLSGPEAAKGPAPTVALLESALLDICMQLDPRLQRSQLGLRLTERCDGMLACYNGGGAAYGAHIDNADGDGRVDGRVLTAVLYLNMDWDRNAGGELSIFEPEFGDVGDVDVRGRWYDVHPEAGTLVLFRSDRMLHEVRPSRMPRYALSLWVCGQSVNYGGS